MDSSCGAAGEPAWVLGMPRFLDHATRANDVIDAASRLIVAGGVQGISLRAIAAELDLSPSTLSAQYTNRERLVRVTAGGFIRRWAAQISARTVREGALGHLPADESDLSGTRVWLAWCEVARTAPDVGLVVGTALREERESLAWALGYPPEDDVALLSALIAGLREAICRSLDPLPVGLARHLLAGEVDRVGLRGSARSSRSPLPR